MTLEQAIHDVGEQRLYVSNLGQGSDARWHCSLRRLEDRPFVLTAARTLYVCKGSGESPVEAIMSACRAAQPHTIADQFEDLLG